MAKKKQQRVRASGSRKRKSDDLANLIAPMRGLVEQNKKIFVDRHEYRPATNADFKGHDRKWYDAAERELAGLGFRVIGDVVDETVAKTMGLVVPIRRLIFEDGTTVAALWHFVQGSGLMKVDLRICDVETELSDGSLLCTSNAEASAAASLPEQIRSTKLPLETPITELVERHEKAKQTLLAGKGGKGKSKLTATVVRTAEDCDAMQHRQEAIKAAFRAGIGYVDPAEVRRIAMQDAPDEPLAAGLAAATADVARRHAQIEKTDPFAAGLMGMLMGDPEKASPADFAKLAMGAMLQDNPNVPAEKQDELAATMEGLFAAGKSGDENAGMKNLFTLMGQLQAMEPEEAKQAKREKFERDMARMQAEGERRRTAHVKKRVAKGLSEQAGTGKPEPEILIHGLPVGDLDYKDKRGRSLDAMVKEINASKARRDAKVLAKLPLGHSRVGGLPDLPPGVKWPTFKGKRIPFVAQLNLADFPKDAHPLLPERGHLYAFALISNDKKMWPPPCSVILYEGDTSTLTRAPFPADDEIWPDWGDERVYEILPATAKPKGRGSKTRSRDSDETLGWLQGEMADYFGTAGEIADDQFGDGGDWINLLALFSVGSMQWSDCGHLYLLIRRSALKKRDFSNVIAAACSS